MPRRYPWMPPETVTARTEREQAEVARRVKIMGRFVRRKQLVGRKWDRGVDSIVGVSVFDALPPSQRRFG